MNTIITNIKNDTEVIFVHALNINLLFVFSHFRKNLDMLLVKCPVLIKPNMYITPTILKFSFVFPKCKHAE
jgi:hypothetical protein